MKDFTYNEKIAVIKILGEILHADNIVHEKEIQYMNEVIVSFGIEIDNTDIDTLITLQALSIIREMEIEKKTSVAQMMGKMIIIDNDINYNEVKLYDAFCKSCDIEVDFTIDNSLGYTLSGPFVNPEDIMNTNDL